MCGCDCVFLVVKQRTAYEVRISDWSSDVCSSDLKKPGLLEFVRCGQPGNARTEHDNVDAVAQCRLQHRHALRMGGAHQSKRLHSGEGGARTAQPRSEERRVGKEYVRTGRSRW